MNSSQIQFAGRIPILTTGLYLTPELGIAIVVIREF